ncbi:hypothetical protein [Streptomyces sp. NPDC003374]
MRLGVDAVTGNRYAFTGGNPVSRIEIDGHECWGSSACYEDKSPTLSDSDRDFLCAYGYMGCANKSKGIPEEDVPDDESPTESVPAITDYGSHADAAQKTTRKVCNQPIGRGSYNCSTVSEYAWDNKPPSGGFGLNPKNMRNTKGICVSASMSFIMGADAEFCWMTSETPDGRIQTGHTFSVGPQFGIGGSASENYLESNADSYQDLSGWGADAQVAAGPGIGGSVGVGTGFNTEDYVPTGVGTDSNGEDIRINKAGITAVTGVDFSANWSWTFAW